MTSITMLDPQTGNRLVFEVKGGTRAQDPSLPYLLHEVIGRVVGIN